MSLGKRIQRLETEANRREGGGVVVFPVNSETADEQFREQMQSYLMRGGNPDALFIQLIDRFE